MPSNPTQPGQSGCSPTPRDEPQPGSHWPLAPYIAPSGPTHQPSVLCSFQRPSLSSDPPASQPHIPALAGRRASPEARSPVPTSTATVQGQRASGCPSNLRVRPQSCPQPAHRPRALTQGSLGRSQLPLTSAHVFLHHLGLRPSPSRGHVPTSQMGPPRQDGGHG